MAITTPAFNSNVQALINGTLSGFSFQQLSDLLIGAVSMGLNTDALQSEITARITTLGSNPEPADVLLAGKLIGFINADVLATVNATKSTVDGLPTVISQLSTDISSDVSQLNTDTSQLLSGIASNIGAIASQTALEFSLQTSTGNGDGLQLIEEQLTIASVDVTKTYPIIQAFNIIPSTDANAFRNGVPIVEIVDETTIKCSCELYEWSGDSSFCKVSVTMLELA